MLNLYLGLIEAYVSLKITDNLSISYHNLANYNYCSIRLVDEKLKIICLGIIIKQQLLTYFSQFNGNTNYETILQCGTGKNCVSHTSRSLLFLGPFKHKLRVVN